jgi:hypothetical protein
MSVQNYIRKNKWKLNNDTGLLRRIKTQRAIEKIKAQDAKKIYEEREEYNEDNLKAMYVTHICMHPRQNYASYRDIPDEENIRGDAEFMVKNFKVWQYGSEMALRCLKMGCLNGGERRTLTKQETADYLNDFPCYDDFYRKRRFLTRCGYELPPIVSVFDEEDEVE